MRLKVPLGLGLSSGYCGLGHFQDLVRPGGERVATVSAVLTVGSSPDCEGIPWGFRALGKAHGHKNADRGYPLDDENPITQTVILSSSEGSAGVFSNQKQMQILRPEKPGLRMTVPAAAVDASVFCEVKLESRDETGDRRLARFQGHSQPELAEGFRSDGAD